MQKMLLKKRTLCCLVAAMVFTVLCISVVHNASIRESLQPRDTDTDNAEETLKFQPQKAMENNEIAQEIDLGDMKDELINDNGAHAFAPDEAAKDSAEDIKGPLEDLNRRDKLEPLEVGIELKDDIESHIELPGDLGINDVDHLEKQPDDAGDFKKIFLYCFSTFCCQSEVLSKDIINTKLRTQANTFNLQNLKMRVIYHITLLFSLILF